MPCLGILLGRGRGGRGSVKGKKIDAKILPVVYMSLWLFVCLCLLLCLLSEGWEKGEKEFEKKIFRNVAGNKSQEKIYSQRRISKAISTALPGL